MLNFMLIEALLTVGLNFKKKYNKNTIKLYGNREK